MAAHVVPRLPVTRRAAIFQSSRKATGSARRIRGATRIEARRCLVPRGSALLRTRSTPTLMGLDRRFSGWASCTARESCGQPARDPQRIVSLRPNGEEIGHLNVEPFSRPGLVFVARALAPERCQQNADELPERHVVNLRRVAQLVRQAHGDHWPDSRHREPRTTRETRYAESAIPAKRTRLLVVSAVELNFCDGV